MSQNQSSAPSYCSFCKNANGSAFAGLKPTELDGISTMKTCLSFKKGQVILDEGARPQGIYCIHSGKAKLYKLGSDGKEQIIRFVKEGDLLGYRSILSSEPISASVTALEDIHTCYIPKKSFLQVITANPKFSLNILEKACSELGDSGKIIMSLAQKTVKERLAEVLLIMHSSFGEDKNGYLDISLTREEMANMIGTATESAIRLLSDFKESGLVESSGRKLKLLNKEGLRDMAKIFD